MRILIVITLSELGGAQSVVANLANVLCQSHDVVVAAGVGDGKMWDLLNPKVKREFCPNLVREISPINDFKTILFFHKLYKKYHPDVVHLHSSKVGVLGRLSFPRRKIVYTVHGFDSIRLSFRKFLPIEKLLQFFCKSIVGVSLYDMTNMISENINHNVSYIFNGIIEPEPLKEDPFEQYSNYNAKILCIARLAPPKNSQLFIDVARLLPTYAFLWIGNKEEVNISLPENVFFLGNIPNASSYIKYTDLFILPSDYEGLPMVIIEAMSQRKPIVASNVGGISEIVRNGVNGYVLDNNSQLFAGKINEILSDSRLYKNFSDASFKIYKEELTADKMVESYIHLYNK